jgi:hypothetical protein
MRFPPSSPAYLCLFNSFEDKSVYKIWTLNINSRFLIVSKDSGVTSLLD